MSNRYVSVNGAWPDGELPIPSPQEALSGAKRLYRLVMGHKWRGKWQLTSGKRYTWPANGVYHVNPNGRYFGGWRDIVHLMSHQCHRRLYPRHKPHDGRGTHAFIERTMIEHVVKSGWLDGKLKRPEKPKPDVQQARQQRVLARIEKWQAKHKRAETALKKLKRQARYYKNKAA